MVQVFWYTHKSDFFKERVIQQMAQPPVKQRKPNKMTQPIGIHEAPDLNTEYPIGLHPNFRVSQP
jgi:hypothetical protein